VEHENMKKMQVLTQCVVLFLLTIGSAHAALQLELTQGMSGALPIAVVPFANDPEPTNFSNVITNDLQNSGRFKLFPSTQMKQTPSEATNVDYHYWQQTGSNNIVVGSIKSLGSNNYQVNIALLDTFKGMANPANGVVITDSFQINSSQFRQLAHKISDLIYQQLTGDRGIFSTKIAYVLVERDANQNPQYLLEVADEDGYNPRPLLRSNSPIMSPKWSPDAKKIAYVSFENQRSAIYLSDIASGSRQLISNSSGMNNAPAFSPDGKTLALVLSKSSGTPNIYTMNLATKALTQLTDGTGIQINTEPSWASDGSSLVFTSNRDGGPQIYRFTFNSGKIQRLTFDGAYNATASFTPKDNHIVLLHGINNSYNIAVQDLAAGAMSVLTQSGNNSSPSIAPNGKMIIYASDNGQSSVLGIVSSDGKIKLTLPAPEGSVREPAWSPFLK
jgi:TolB protein